MSTEQDKIIANPSEWITVRQAAARTGISVRTWRWRAASEHRQAERAGRGSLARKAPPPSGKGRRTWWVHRSMDRRLALAPTREVRNEQARESLLARHPRHLVHRAWTRVRWMQEWRNRCERSPDIASRVLAEQVAAEAREIDDVRISARSLQRWWQCYRRPGPDGRISGVEALVDRYAQTDDGTAARNPKAVDTFYDLYRCQNRPSIRVCHEITRLSEYRLLAKHDGGRLTGRGGLFHVACHATDFRNSLDRT